MKQKIALEALKNGHNIFLTGPAGSGKTFLLNRFVDYLKRRRIKVAVTATTGIAATHMGGTTIHSWCGMGVKEGVDDSDLLQLFKKNRLRKRLEKTEVLVIDEISMLHDFQLDIIDKICRKLKRVNHPFGGLQVILCGDFFQLPPVAKQGKANFVFHSEVWQEMEFKVCYLDENYRQKGNVIIEALNDIRSGEIKVKTLEIIRSRLHAEIVDIPKPTRLFTHNTDVDAVNSWELAKIKEKTYAYRARYKGRKVLVEMLKNGCLAPAELMIKKGAQVMFVKNNFEVGYVNGTLGAVIGFNKESGMPIVRTVDGGRINVHPERWELVENDKVVASITQVPLRLAWAITVHKSQGMSLDAAEVDLSKTFEYGMGYVALSRVRSLEGLKLLGLNDMALQVSPDVLTFNTELFRLSAEFEVGLLKDKKLDKSEVAKTGKAYSVKEIRKKYENTYEPWSGEEDKALLILHRENLSIKELAKVFSRQPGSIKSRLDKLGLKGADV